jgi:alpha-beta hydrolase superfamily lysophospholipase
VSLVTRGPFMKLYPENLSGLFYSIFRIIVVFYLIVAILIFFFQERLIFFPSKLAADYQFQFKSPHEERYFEVDGKKVHSLLFKSSKSNELILYFHGNAGDLSSWGEVAEEIVRQTGLSVWILDYPGYGKSEGSITSEEQLHKVATKFLETAKTSVSLNQIIIYGRSIGSGLAVKLASENKPAALILESPYFSLQNVGEDKFFWAPLFLLKYKLHSDLWMAKVNCPILIVQGDEDEVIPFSQGKKLAAILNSIEFVPIRHGHHNDLADFSEYWKSLNDFINKVSSLR